MPDFFLSLERSCQLTAFTLVMFLVKCILYNFSRTMYSSHQTIETTNNDYSKTLILFVSLKHFCLLTGLMLVVFLVKNLLYYPSCTTYFLHQNVRTISWCCSMVPAFFVSLEYFCWLTCSTLIVFLVYKCPWYKVFSTMYFSRIFHIRTSKLQAVVAQCLSDWWKWCVIMHLLCCIHKSKVIHWLTWTIHQICIDASR